MQSALSDVRALRIELRFHDFQFRPPSGQQILNACSHFLQLQGNSQFLRLTDFASSSGSSHVHDMTGRRDVIVRIQYLPEQSITLFEIWNGDGKNYAVQKLPARQTGAKCERDVIFGSNGRGEQRFNGSLAYFRWFDTTVPAGEGPSNSPEGAILSYEFEQNADEGQGGRGLRISGDANYVQTPVYAPLVTIRNGNRTVNANEPVELDGSGSLAVGGSISSWHWEQVRGPVQVTIENRETAKAVITGATDNGTYEFRLNVTDSRGQTSSGTVLLGVVPANEYGIVQVSDPALSFALGPLMRAGRSPWPFYDQLRNEMGRKWGENYPEAPPGEKDYRDGKITLTPGSRIAKGTGTKFVQDFLASPAFVSGSTIEVNTGATEVRGAGTQFFRTFLRDIRDGLGVARLENNSVIVRGEDTKFKEQFVTGAYILMTIPAAGFNQPEERAFRVSKVIDDHTLELDHVWRGGDLPPGSFRAARETGKILVIEEPGGKLWYFQPVVQSETSIALPRSYEGLSGTALRYGTAGVSGYDHLIVHYPLEEEGQQGRKEIYISGILSDDEILLGGTYSGRELREVSFGRAKSEELSYWQDGLNYYDSVLVQYQNYYRTGLDSYLNYARRLADAWYTMFDSGRNPTDSPLAARMIGLNGLIVRALDGRPDMWPMIRRAVRYNYSLWVGQRRNYPGLYYGVRDGGFSLYFAALMAKADPDPERREEFLRMAHDGAVNLYARLQEPDGSWRWEDQLWKGRGEQPFHVGLLLEGMIATHRLTHDPVILQSILRSVDHLIEIQQPAPCRSPVYAIYNDDGPWGQFCKEGNGRPTADQIKDSRAGNNTILHAIGYAYAVTGLEKYKLAGDDMFAATFGNRQGPGADEYWGRADTTTKQYGQSFRSTDAYLAYSVHTPGSLAIPDL